MERCSVFRLNVRNEIRLFMNIGKLVVSMRFNGNGL